MPTFVALRVDNSDEVIHVNMDAVIKMERHADQYTSLTFGETNVTSNVTVRETPEEIMDMIWSARKS
jgi:hypothetical protein